LGLSVRASNPHEFPPHLHINFGRPAHVIAHKKVEIAIVVNIEPGRAGAPLLLVASDSGFRSDILEFSVPQVFEQMILAYGGDKDIHKPVVIEIAKGGRHAVDRHIQSRAGGYILEISLAVILVEHGGRRLFSGGNLVGPISAVHEKEVLVSVIIVIEKTN